MGEITQLFKSAKRCQQIVELKFFAGPSVDEIAQTQEVSSATVKRDWQKTRAYLYRSLRE